MINIREFSFNMSALMSPHINIQYKDGCLQYSYDQFFSSEKRYEEKIYKKSITPSEEQWLEFFQIFDTVNVSEWSDNTYLDNDILDGTSWKFCMDGSLFKDGNQIIYKVLSDGYEVFPDGFDIVVEAIEKLIHDSITSRVYNAQVIKDFMKNNIKGEENRRNLFKKVSAIILEVIEGKIDLYLLDYSMEDILVEYMNILRFLGISETDESIMKYYILGCEGNKNEIGIDIVDFINPSLKELYENKCRMLLAEADIWYLDKEAQEDLDIVFMQIRMILLYEDQRNACCEFYNRDNNKLTLKALSLELAETVTNLKKYTDENKITHESYNPKVKFWLTGNVIKYLEHIEEEAIKIKEIGCCIRQYDYTLLKDEAVHDLALVLAKKLFDEILKFIDRLHITFQRAELITKELIIWDGDIIDLVEVMSKNHDFSDILPLIKVFK